MKETKMLNSAILSPCRNYRYSLTRQWDTGTTFQLLTFCMLNPSTADESANDPTIRRCISFARREGFGGIRVVNLFGLRATDPSDILKAEDPFGPDNGYHVAQAAMSEAPIVCAWGARGTWCGAENMMIDLFRLCDVKLVCLGKTTSGCPRHPLYIKSDQPLVPFA